MNHLKLFLLTRNEPELLEDWIRYHGYFFGFHHIHVLDGSNDETIIAVYDKYKPLGLNVHFSNSNLNSLAQEMTELMHQHKGGNNFLIKLDTDEFLAYSLPADDRPQTFVERIYRSHFIRKYDGKYTSKISGLLDRAYDRSFRRKSIMVDNFQDFFARLPVTGQRYKASLTMWSEPRKEYSSRPCQEIVRFTLPQFTHLKTFFHSESFVSVDLGSHSGISTNNKGFIDTGLTIIHYHSTSIKDTMRRARQALQSHGYISPDDSSDQELKKLSQLENQLMNSRHKINLYLTYLRASRFGREIPAEILNQHHPYFIPSEVQEMLLVKNVIESLDS